MSLLLHFFGSQELLTRLAGTPSLPSIAETYQTQGHGNQHDHYHDDNYDDDVPELVDTNFEETGIRNPPLKAKLSNLH